jgi:hypothetical protein
MQSMTSEAKTRSAINEDNGSKHAEKQFVVNTSHGKPAEKKGETNGSKKKASSQESDYNSATNCTTHWEDPDHLERNLQEYKSFQEGNRKSIKDKDDQMKKRGHGVSGSSPNKKQKGSGEHDEPVGAAGSITRVPKHGQKVQWHSLAGYTDGEVVEVAYEDKEVDGKKIKASKEEPQIVLKSESSGKICVHKPDAVYF